MGNIRTSASFGQAVRSRRRSLGLSQEQVAAEAGVGRRFVVELERGKPGASLELALRVASRLGLDLEMVPREHG